jgi:hypothetical protein
MGNFCFSSLNLTNFSSFQKHSPNLTKKKKKKKNEKKDTVVTTPNYCHLLGENTFVHVFTSI